MTGTYARGAGTRTGTASVGEPLLPRYGDSTLGELLPSIAAHLGVNGYSADPLGLPGADSYVVVLVDGLGWQLVRSRVRELTYLADLLGDARPITSAVPSTTATSLTSLGTGLPPGRHGIVGYTFWLPECRQVLNPLTWDVDVAPTVCQPWPTVFDAARADGVSVNTVSLRRFADSGLTRAALRGPSFLGLDADTSEDQRISLITAAAHSGHRSLVYVYERELDHTGHAQGVRSDAWHGHLLRIDRFLGRLREALPPSTTLVITGDHGMIDVPPDHRVIVEDEPALLDGVDVLAGEGRLRQLQLRPGVSVDEVAAAWRERLGALAWIRTRDEAIAEGWFGTANPMVIDRLGQVLVALRSDWAVMTRALPRELGLVGMHGSLTPDEMQVPLFVDTG